ncbi:3-hydroxyacyl-CoA dehydrogenase NAD-binding domain-containing protein [Caulobacter sp. DWR1-3-2b1]|uniref:3-hydroxyacyl-CoA dehydrogenase NAD-binding domain-containing protein n=1 Tax=Caulobacter sp. DWR1-3-2b1 TaxID=2804670 RepID=UPI003CFB3FAE
METAMTAINAVTDLSVEGDIGVVTLNSPPVNALSAIVREGLQDAFNAAIADQAVKAIVLICAGKTFIAGADITEFGKPMTGPTLQEVQAVIENSPKPVIAAIHGTVLGGGLEVALVANYRVATPSAKCGLPEVNIGLLPGAGGTQRLPRIVGPEKALEMVTSGQHVPAKAALAMGLFDELVDETNLRGAAIDFARTVLVEKRPLKKVRDLNDKVEAARGKPEIFAAFRAANAKKFRGFKAPEYNIQTIEAAVNLPFEEGLKVERKLFLELMTGSQSAAQRHVFFAERQAAKIPDVPDDTPILPVKKVGVIGAGTMGGGISMNFLNAGIPVTIIEMKQENLDRGVGVIRKNYENTAKKGRLTQDDVEQRMGLLTPSMNLEDLADCDLIIEAVFELMEIKKEVFGKLDQIAKPGAILASNTSYLDIDVIAASTSRPESVIGLHFFSPANVMRLLEIVRGEKTDKSVIATSMQIGKKIGKVAVLVGNCNGFVGNRMLAQRQREAQKLILEGAMPWDVDRVLYDFGLPMGPFAMSDLAGLDIGWDPAKTSSSTVREVLCEMDRRGQKNGKGFYDYDENRVAKPSAIVEQVIADFAEKRQIQRREITDQEILERCLYPMVNEGAKILEEGKAIRASDIDTVWLNGYGWPVYSGGPMFWGELVGLDKILAKMREFQAKHGDDFKPSALLERLVAEGKGFKDA